MCWLAGSIEHQTSVCPMCTFFKSGNARCPHKRDICRNTANHAREVAYIKNAEVTTFNGCGYCKWARQNPNASPATRNNGWPGCCRPPASGERVPPADWPAVSAVHGVQVPADVKALLDSINVPKPGTPPSKSSSPNLGSPTQSSRSPSSATQSKPRTPPLAIPPRASRAIAKERKDKDSPERSATKDLSPNTPSPLRRPSVSRAPKQPSGAVDERTPPATLRRRSSATDTRREQPPTRERERDIVPRNATIGPSRSAPRASALDTDFGMAQMSLNSPLSPGGESGSDGGSVSGGSSSDGTVTSDGGFTDYLSDESEAELQRQAEARALLLAQSHAEDAEFRAARKQLAQVDLRVPKAWNTGGAQKGVALSGYARR
ncbi:unnamed protein product [Peniophora sp. CBMAI 1063]|nr:unnamed protein product [Peniophora sp. CBMAI 1063]